MSLKLLPTAAAAVLLATLGVADGSGQTEAAQSPPDDGSATGRGRQVVPLTLTVGGREYPGPPALFEVTELQPPPRFVLYGMEGEGGYISIELVLAPATLPAGRLKIPLGNPALEAGVSQMSFRRDGRDFYSIRGIVELDVAPEGELSGALEARLAALGEGAEEIEVRGSFAGRWVVECRVIVEPGAGAASPGSSAETADSLQWRTDRELSSPFCSRFKSRR